MNQLVELEELEDDWLFKPEVLDMAARALHDLHGPMAVDVNTPEGRKEIVREGRAVGGIISRFDARRKEYVAELKRRPKEIDTMFREHFRKPAEALKEKIIRPLKAWEEDQRAAEEEVQTLIDEIRCPLPVDASAVDMVRKLNDLKSTELPDWATPNQRDAITAALNEEIERVTAEHKRQVQIEEMNAELERLREIERKRDFQREADERGMVDAPDAAKQAAISAMVDEFLCSEHTALQFVNAVCLNRIPHIRFVP